MKYAFFGTPEFAATILEKLIKAGWPPAVLVCNPDKPAGRKQIITPPPTKQLAQKFNIKVWQPQKLEIGNWKLEIGEADFAIVAAYAKILPKEIINTLRLGIIGVHPSLLPKYRGATPIQSVILNAEPETGITLFLLDEKVDHGPILASSKLQVTSDKNYKDLEHELALLAADLLIKTLPKFVNGKIKPQVQDENEATYTKKFTTQDGFVDINSDAPEIIYRKIRALNPEPGIYTIINGQRIKIIDEQTIQIAGKKSQKVADAITFLKS